MDNALWREACYSKNQAYSTKYFQVSSYFSHFYRKQLQTVYDTWLLEKEVEKETCTVKILIKLLIQNVNRRIHVYHIMANDANKKKHSITCS